MVAEERPGEDGINGAGREDDRRDDTEPGSWAEITIQRNCCEKAQCRPEVCKTDAFESEV